MLRINNVEIKDNLLYKEHLIQILDIRDDLSTYHKCRQRHVSECLASQRVYHKCK